MTENIAKLWDVANHDCDRSLVSDIGALETIGLQQLVDFLSQHCVTTGQSPQATTEFCELAEKLMRTYELRKSLVDQYHIGSRWSAVSEHEIDAEAYLRVAAVLALVGASLNDLRFVNVSLKILDSECNSVRTAGACRETVKCLALEMCGI